MSTTKDLLRQVAFLALVSELDNGIQEQGYWGRAYRGELTVVVPQWVRDHGGDWEALVSLAAAKLETIGQRHGETLQTGLDRFGVDEFAWELWAHLEQNGAGHGDECGDWIDENLAGVVLESFAYGVACDFLAGVKV